EVLWQGERATGVRYEVDGAPGGVATAEFVVDASGQGAIIGHARGVRTWDPFFRNLAIYGYFDGAKHLDPPEQGNILVESFAHGWSWTIPQHTGVSSVGVVLDAERAQADMRGRDVRE